MALQCPWMTQSCRLLAIAIRVEVLNKKNELQEICKAMVGFIGWTSAPGTFVKSENRLEDLQLLMPLRLSVALAGINFNAWYDIWMIFLERTATGMSSTERESQNNPLTSAMQRNNFSSQNMSVAMGWRRERTGPSASEIEGSG